MRLLLDTHALLWWLAGSEELPAAARAAIEANPAYVSAATAWEIATCRSRSRTASGRGRFPVPPRTRSTEC